MLRGRKAGAATVLAAALAVSACGSGALSSHEPAATEAAAARLNVAATVITHDSATLQRALSFLRGQGLSIADPRGATVVGISGSAAQIDRGLGVTIVTHGSGSSAYYAPAATPVPPPVVGAALAGFTGLSDRYPAVSRPLVGGDGLPASGGYNMSDLFGMYDVNALHQAGDLGQGQTIVLLEIDKLASRSDITQFDATNKLPSLNLTTRTDSADWGTPAAPQGETNLDVEIAHAVAPDAAIVIYEASPRGGGLEVAAQAAISEHPGAIISESIGGCEADPAAPQLVQTQTRVAQRATATGSTWLVSSGDSGAYGCAEMNAGPTLDTQLSVNPFADPADITSVGGTSAFEGPHQSYGHEIGWGDPIEVWGSGGGVSTLVPQPSWQTGPGVDNQFSTGMRQQPDVAGLADLLTGINIVVSGQTEVIGGTSAAAPFWAGVVALGDTKLKQEGLPELGNINPSLYYFGNHLSALPAAPFHDITEGNNFAYPATPGWDYVTGWGTPDVGNLITDWIAYKKQGGP